ncbi:MAG: hypothetical protein KCHDKBKB_01022 [Elusimicrobia bacterium]|nr:hypothetical protein [Elusimicrobiota bacterium]
MTSDGTYQSWSLSYPFREADAGRAKSIRPKQSNDCAVRALAMARTLPYDEAYDLLAAAGRKSWRGFALHKWLNQQTWAKKIAFPPVKGQRRMNPATFCQKFREGVFICRVAKHVFTVIDGIVYDTFASRPDRCIYTAWKIELPEPS